VSEPISAKDVAALRARTGAGMMDCKKALEETGGDVDRAVEVLRVKGQAQAAKRGERVATEGTVQAYLHSVSGKIGVLIEVDCETDFVARNEEFVAFARDIAQHIAGAAPPPEYVSEDDIPEEVRETELRIAVEQLSDKPEDIREKAAQGMVKKRLGEMALLSQTHVNADKHDGKTIEQLRAELAAKTGENVVIRRFQRFAVGE
jgi:elongation factor Ts